jgi:hypothetical protein
VRRIPAKDYESEKSMPDECVGPITIPASVGARLRELAAAAGIGEFTALSVCAWALAGRLSRDGAARAVRMSRGPREVITPPGPGPAGSFRAVLLRAGDDVAASIRAVLL